MKAGALRHRRSIEVPVGGSSWGTTTSWSTFATVWCSIEPLSGRDFFAAQATQSEISHRIRMRYIDGVRPNMRLNHGGRYLLFVAVRNVDERNRELEIDAKEVA
jgi:SPP1 family predicted phage head-tail adaptor